MPPQEPTPSPDPTPPTPPAASSAPTGSDSAPRRLLRRAHRSRRLRRRLRRPPPPDAARFNIQHGDNVNTVEQILKSIDADDALKPYLGGHVLSYTKYPVTTGNRAPIREQHGLPATGTDFLDASGLAAAFASESFGNVFRRDAGRGNGAGWNLASNIRVFSNWVDGVFFGTSHSKEAR